MRIAIERSKEALAYTSPARTAERSPSMDAPAATMPQADTSGGPPERVAESDLSQAKLEQAFGATLWSDRDPVDPARSAIQRATPVSAAAATPELPPALAAAATEVAPTGTSGTNTTTLTITGAPSTRYKITVTAAASAGHSHASPTRPVGKIAPSDTVTTGADGIATVTYTSSVVGGVEKIVAKKVGVANAPEVTLDITVRVAGLVPLRPGAGYDLIGQTARHPDNHYGTASAVAAYQAVGTSWAAIPTTVTGLAAAVQTARAQPKAPAVPQGGLPLTNAAISALLANPTQVALEALSNAQLAQVQAAVQNWPTLGYNDMSLAKGGVFDLGATWAPSHITHREGTTMDLSLKNLGAVHRAVVEQLMTAQGIKVFHEDAQHWHLTAP
jgi:hypothetical protein